MSAKYIGHVRLIAFKDFGEHVSKHAPYTILQQDITQFSHTVPLLKDLVIEGITEKEDPAPYEWLTEHMGDSLDYDLEDILDQANANVSVREYFELSAMINIRDTSGWADCGYEHDCETEYHEVSVRKFRLNDLKESYYYDVKEVASWIEQTMGLAKGETVEDIEERLKEDGFDKFMSLLDEDFEEENNVTEDNIC